MRLFEDINYLGPVYVDGRLNNHITIHWFAPEVWIIQGGQTVRRQFSLAFFLGNGSCFRKSCAIFNKGVIEMIMMTLRSILVHMAYSRPHSSVHVQASTHGLQIIDLVNIFIKRICKFHIHRFIKCSYYARIGSPDFIQSQHAHVYGLRWANGPIFYM